MSEIANSEPAPEGSPFRVLGALVWAPVLAAAVFIGGFGVYKSVSPLVVGLFVILRPEASLSDEALRLYVSLASPLAGIAFVGVYWLLVRLVERRAVVELAPRGAWIEAARGVGLAAAAFLLLMVVLTSVGAIAWRPPPVETWLGHISAGLAFGIASGVLTAIVLQGVLTRLLAQTQGPVFGVVAAAFAAAWWTGGSVHVNAQLGALIDGLMLALIFLRRERLWLGMGVVATWDGLMTVVRGGFYHGDGGNAARAFIFAPEQGPLISWLRGPGGPDASVPALVGGALVAGFLAWRAFKEGRFTRA